MTPVAAGTARPGIVREGRPAGRTAPDDAVPHRTASHPTARHRTVRPGSVPVAGAGGASEASGDAASAVRDTGGAASAVISAVR